VDYATKLIVLLSVATAILLEAFLSARAWPNQLPLTIAAFFVTASSSLALADLSAAIVLFFVFLMPALLLVVHGDYSVYYGTIWVAALLGAIVPASVRRGWRFPARWKAPLVLWALTIALTWPIVVMREFDFKPRLLLNAYHLNRWDIEALRPIAIVWICDVASTLAMGLLWFDWLCCVFGDDELRFRRRLLPVLAASWSITTVVGLYQFFGDMLFLNSGLFGALKRAPGTMRDANPFGIVAALGGPWLVAAASLTRSRLFYALTVCGLVVSWVALWASGARSALALAVIAFVSIVYAVWAALVKNRYSRWTQIGLAAAIAVLAVAVVTAAPFLVRDERGPIARMRDTLADSSVRGFLQTLSDRYGYGLVAMDMIRQFPFFGVGIGSFNLLVRDHYYVMTGVRTLFPDNAQNWYRHQLAELGLVGSVGWILWVVSFGWFVLSTTAPPPRKFAMTVARGLLTALALVSLVGMPTLNVAVAITFWTLAFWCVALSGVPTASLPSESVSRNERLLAGRSSRWTWLVVWSIVAASIGGTAYTARHRLRIPQLAVDVGFPYHYGFSEPERVDLANASSVWTGRHAVAVLFPPTRWVKVTLSVDSLNVAKGPVDVKMWCAGQLVVATKVASVQPIMHYVQLPEGAMRLLVETRVSRSVRPADFGLKDTRELGLLVGWEFVEAPPG
jgi:O-antigen ligase